MNHSKPDGLLPLPLVLVCAALVIVGAVAFAIGLATAPARAWAAFLVSGFYTLALSLAGGVFLVIRMLTGAGWSALFIRVPEAMAGVLPLLAVPFALIVLGMPHLYHWAHHGAAAHDAVLAAKAPWLNPAAFAVRLILFLVLWSVVGRKLVAQASGDDATASWSRRVRAAVLFALVFAPTFSLASVDWLMSVEPHWSSTLYPWYVFATSFAGGLAMLTLLVLAVHARSKLPGLTVYHRHDLGKLVFAFSFFWGYLWFCQYMLIWYANIPEEVTHYVARTSGGWMAPFVANALVNLVVPFLALVSARAKKATPVLAATCALVVAGHWLDVHMLVMPAVCASGPVFTLVDVLVAAGSVSFFLLAVDRRLGHGSVVAEGDPFLAESLAHHGA
jgi:hypothetical protein